MRIEPLEERTLLAVNPVQASFGEPGIKGPEASMISGELARLGQEFEAFDVALAASGQSASATGDFSTENPFITVVDDSVVVDAVASAGVGELVADLEALGMTVTGTTQHMVSGLLPLGAIDSLPSVPSLNFIRTSAIVLNEGATDSQGDVAIQTNVIGSFLGFEGTGQKIGVLSDSYDFLGGAAADIASGDLPGAGNPNGYAVPVDVIADSAVAGSTDEGRAMLQIVHDVAPAAELAFATTGTGQVAYAANIAALVAAGCTVIVDDVMDPNEPMFQDGPIAQAVDAAVAAGVSYFSSAGNSARDSYEGGFVSSGNASPISGGDLHDFDTTAAVDTHQRITVPVGAAVTISFQWPDPYFSVSGAPGTATDMDIGLLGLDGNVIPNASATNGNIGGDPAERLDFVNDGTIDVDGVAGPDTSFDLVIEHLAGPAPALMKYVVFSRDAVSIDEYDTASPTTYGHANAAGASAVGAAYYADTPEFGTDPPLLEPSSSAGGVQIYYDTAGNPVGPIVRQTPDIVAPDGTNTTFFGRTDVDGDGFLNFFGTSAAAPHAAALGALVREASPASTPGQVDAALETTAIDMAAAGYDNDTGFGMVDGVGAIAATGGPFTVTVDAGANADDGLGDDFLIRRDAGGNVEVLIDGTLEFEFPLVNTADIVVNGSTDSDTLTVDYGGGSPVPAGGIVFAGGVGPTDSLILTGGAADTITHTFTNETDGAVAIDRGGPIETITYTGLEPIDDNMIAANRVFTFTANDITGDLNASPAIPALFVDPTTHTRIDSNASEYVDFTTPGTSLAINLAGGANTFTVTSLAGNYAGLANTLSGAAGVDTFNFETTGDGTGTSPWTVNGGGASDVLNLSPVARDLDNLDSAIDYNANTAGDADELNVFDDNQGDADVFTVTDVSIDRADFGGVTYDADTELVNLTTGGGDDTINVNSTSASATTTINGQGGDDDIIVWPERLRGTNVFNGDGGNDFFNLNFLDDTSVDNATSVEINGGPNAADTDNRDVVLVDVDGVDTIARTIGITYAEDLSGDVDITGLGGLGGLDINTVETLDYVGNGPDDIVTVTGTAADDDLTVAPLSLDEAMVFRGGNPWDGPMPADPEPFADAIPGVGDGGFGPDMRLGGLASLAVDGGAGALDHLYVYGTSEADLVDPGTIDDLFGFGAGVVIPGSTNPLHPSSAVPGFNAFDEILMNDTQVRFVDAVENELPPPDPPPGATDVLLPVDIVTASFVQPDELTFGLTVNAGSEAAPAVPLTPGVDTADDIVAELSDNFSIQVNGGDPILAAPAVFPPDGDRLQVDTPEEVNLFSDKSGPPVVTVTSGGPFGVGFSSIEYALFTPGNHVVNLIGDNNDPAPAADQTDNFVVVGRDIDGDPRDAGQREFQLEINGSSPIFLDDVDDLNVIGNELVDTLEITPYADDTPRGWGIDVHFDEGLPDQIDGLQADLLIVHTSLYGGEVSEDIVVRPSGPEDGEVVITNGSFDTPIVDIDFINNLDLIILDDDGFANDTDTLTLLGTDPDNPPSDGDDTVLADFSAAGDLANPWITVIDDLGGNGVPDTPPGATDDTLMYRVRNFDGFSSLNFALLGGADLLEITPDTANANGLQNLGIHYDGGDPIGILQGTGDTLNVISGGEAISFQPGPEPDSGSFTVDGNEPISFDELELLQVNGVNYILPDVFEPNDNRAEATVLGSLPEITLRDLSLHDEGAGVINEDFFRITAHDTGMMIINALFLTGAGLGDVDIEVQDGTGAIIAPNIALNEVAVGQDQIVIPVVSQEVYYLHVTSDDALPNNYELEIENFPAPVPALPDLVPASDTGPLDNDNVTFDNAPTFIIEADLAAFQAQGILLDRGVGTDGAEVFLRATSIADGTFADVEAALVNDPANPNMWTATFAALLPDVYEVEAWVQVEDEVGNVGRSLLSAPLAVTVDTTAPENVQVLATFDLLTASDTFDDVAGLLAPGPRWTDADDVTRIASPAFSGVAEANATIRIFANGELVGTGVVGTDDTDGTPGDGLGLWEITVEPLADDTYDLTVEVEDLAGNITLVDPALAQADLVVDTLAPQRPTLDLVSTDDTGSSDLDDVSNLADPVSFVVTAELDSRVLVKDGETVIADFLFDAAFDATDGVPGDGAGLLALNLAEGSHLLSAEAFDMPGNRSAQSEELGVTIDRTAPADADITIDLVVTSDTGVIGDGATAKDQPAFHGVAEANTLIRVFADDGRNDRVLVGTGIVGSDESDGVPGNGLGIWEVTVEPMADGIYTFDVDVEDLAGNVLTPSTDDEILIIDPFEVNDTLPTATVLGSLPSLTLRDVKLHAAGDVDMFRITAHDTGKLVINTLFDLAEGDVNVVVHDSAGNAIATGAVGAGGEQIIIPVVSQEQYFLEVSLATDPAGTDPGNLYDLEIENFAAPVPSTVTLDPNDDSGLSNLDLVTFVDDARVFVIADLDEFAGSGIAILDAAAADGTNDGAAVEMFVNGASVGFATRLLGNNLLWAYEFQAGDLVSGIPIGPNSLVGTMTADEFGQYNIVTSSVRIFDPAVATAQGRTQQSESLRMTFDANVPNADMITMVMADYSDTGVIDATLITAINQPAFLGVAEANTRIRLFVERLAPDPADPATLLRMPGTSIDLVGQGLVGSDTSEVDTALGTNVADIIGLGGAIDDGLGLWEITVEPLDDGVYNLFVEIEDVAGNSTRQVDGPTLQFEIDTLPPQRPTIDLVGPDVVDNDVNGAAPLYSDTGRSTMDNVTFGHTVVYGNDPTTSDDDLARVQVRVSAEAGSEVWIKDGEDVIHTFPMPIPAAGAPVGFVFVDLLLDEDPHPLSVEAFDAVGLRSHQSEELLVTIDLTAPTVATLGLLDSSDSSENDDHVTNEPAPAFGGTAEANAQIRIFADRNENGAATGNIEQIGAGIINSDQSDPPTTINPPNTQVVGTWEVTVEPLVDGLYDLTVEVEDLAGNIGTFDPDLNPGVNTPVDIEIDTLAPNLAYLDLLDADDTGRSDVDNITYINAPEMSMTSEDATAIPDLFDHLLADNLVFRIFDRYEADAEFLLYDSSLDAPVYNQTDPLDTFTSLEHVLETLPTQFIGLNPAGNVAVQTVGGTGVLADGIHNLKLEVEDRAGNISHDFLLDVLIDTVAPNGAFGDSAVIDDGLHTKSDTGIFGFLGTFADRITSDTSPLFWGETEANALVRIAVDGNGTTIPGTPGGTSVAVPLDGNDAFPPPGVYDGNFFLQSILNLPDGEHRIDLYAEDVAGNGRQADTLDTLYIFIDTEGPVVTNVTRGVVSTDAAFSFDGESSLFEPKPTGGPDPLVSSIVVHFSDGPLRTNLFQHEALFQALAQEEGNYRLVADANGDIPIIGVNLIPAFQTTVSGQIITDSSAGNLAILGVELVFHDPGPDGLLFTDDDIGAPLPDDRFSLHVSDELADYAGNRLDGESAADAPFEGNDFANPTLPVFPTGDQMPGGAFDSRFTIDSRAEIGTWSAGSVYVDINGNFRFDPANPDYVNRDITYLTGFASDNIFAGNFGVAGVTDGFDKLAVYGRNEAGLFRWVVDTDNDGVGVDDIVTIEPADFIGLGTPVAGNFDGNAANGDEVGLFDGTTWLLDVDHDFLVSDEVEIEQGLKGYPIVGDFDGDGADDLATYLSGTFSFDLAGVGGLGNGIDGTIPYDFIDIIGVRERPVAADMNADGIDDLGLWVPDRSGVLPIPSGEWYFLISDRSSHVPGTLSSLDHSFTPVPFGPDLFAQFGDDFAAPIVGNFDPPTVGPGTTSSGMFTLVGTAAADRLEFTIEDDGSFEVIQDGLVQSVPAGTTAVTFDGLGGNDTVLFTGSSGAETIDLSPGSGEFFADDALVLSVANIERIRALGGGGSDVANLSDLAGQPDTLVATPDHAVLYGNGYNNRVESFAQVNAVSSDTNDVAKLHASSSGANTFTATPEYGTLSGDGYQTRAEGFRYVNAYSSSGEDVATLYDGAGADSLTAMPEYVTLAGSTFMNRAKGFRSVQAFSSGGADEAKLYDDPAAVDTFTATPTSATLTGVNYLAQANAFPVVSAYSRGGDDTAELYDNASADDSLFATPTGAEMTGGGYVSRAIGFRYVDAFSAGGNDAARIMDSVGDDIFEAHPEYSILRGAEFSVRASAFSEVQAFSTAGGNDQAFLYDSVLAESPDSLAAGDSQVTLSNLDLAFSYWIADFEEVEATLSNPSDSQEVDAAVDFLVIHEDW